MPDNKDTSFNDTLTATRRKIILDAATKTFAEKGFHRTTIRDIAREAGIADGTIYIYFENKDALLLALLDRLNETEQRTQHFTRPDKPDFANFLRSYLEQRLSHFQTEGFDLVRVAFAELLINPALRDRYRQQVLEPTFAMAEPYIARLADEGRIRSSDTQLTSRIIASLAIGALMLNLLEDPYLKDHWAEVPDALADLLLYGLTNPIGEPHE